MIKTRIAAMILASILSGCSVLPFLSMPFGLGGKEDAKILTNTSVSLSKSNYTIVKANAVGESWGVSLLGLIPVTSPYYTEAITQIYEQAGEMEGKPRALTNIVHQSTSNFYLLFSVPRITVRADIVEFKAGDGE